MPSPIRRTLNAYAADARAAFTAAPVEVALGLLLSVLFSLYARNRIEDFDFVRAAASVALAFPLVFALSVLRSRGVISAAARWGGAAAVLAACAAFGALLLREDREADGWRWMALAAAAVLLLVMTPALPWRARERRAEWAFAWRLVVRVVGIGLYSAALFALLAGAVGAVVTLFDLGRPEHLYTDLAGAVFFAFAPWILVGGIHRLSAPAEPGVPLAVSRLGTWLYAPVLVIYLLILYAYAGRVLITGELPRNLVSPLVIAAGLIGLIGAVLLEPVHEDDEHRGLSMLVRGIPALLLPLVPLAMWALLARLDEYGWTEFRYLRLAAVVAIGILAVMGTARWIRRRPPLLSSVPAVLAGVALISAIGPWSATAVSRRDQTARLRGEFHEARIDPRSLPADSVWVDSASLRRIDSGIRYLVEAHGVAALKKVIPAAPDSLRPAWRVAERLGLRGHCQPSWHVLADVDWEGGVGGMTGGTVQQVLMRQRDTASVRMGAARVTLAMDRERVRVAADGWTGTADLAAVVRALVARAVACDPVLHERQPQIPAAQALLPVRDASGAVRAQLLVTHVAIDADTDSAGAVAYGLGDMGALLVFPD